MELNRRTRRRLRAALTDHVGWLRRVDAGPTAVDAGSCDRCGSAPRLLPTCGPVAWRALCRDCALEVDADGWCDGHAEDAEELLDWARQLPAWWADAVVLWWIATGEVDPPPDDDSRGWHRDLPNGLRTALPRAGGGAA